MGLRLAGAALAAALLVAGDAAARSDEAARLMNELMSGKSPVGGDFSLKDHNGRARSLAEFRGKLVLLYFGYTTCPDVCPTDLAQIGRAVRSLGNDSLQVQPLFITLDPARDTAPVLRRYVTSFHPRFIALRGTEAETRAVARSFKVFHERTAATAKSRDYLIDHTAYIFLLDREGRFVGFFPTGTPSERIAALLRERLKKE